MTVNPMEHVNVLQEPLSVSRPCAICEEPTPVAHALHSDELGEVCGGCKRVAELVREELRARAQAESRERMRRRLVLAREGIYGS